MGFDAGMKRRRKRIIRAQALARRSFLTALAEEIAAYHKLEALYREGAITIPKATRDAELLPTERGLDRILRQERMVELGCQSSWSSWSAWRRGKAAGVAEIRLRATWGRPIGDGARSVGRPKGRTTIQGELRQ